MKRLEISTSRTSRDDADKEPSLDPTRSLPRVTSILCNISKHAEVRRQLASRDNSVSTDEKQGVSLSMDAFI